MDMKIIRLKQLYENNIDFISAQISVLLFILFDS